MEFGSSVDGNLAPWSHCDIVTFPVESERYDFPVSLQVFSLWSNFSTDAAAAFTAIYYCYYYASQERWDHWFPRPTMWKPSLSQCYRRLAVLDYCMVSEPSIAPMPDNLRHCNSAVFCDRCLVGSSYYTSLQSICTCICFPYHHYINAVMSAIDVHTAVWVCCVSWSSILTCTCLYLFLPCHQAKWLACWTQVQKSLGSNRSHHAVR